MSEIDFSGLKKKKKKAVVESLESLTLESQEEVYDFSDLKKKKKKKETTEQVTEQVLPKEGDERDYTYHELLSRVFGMIRQHNPELVGEKKKFTIPPPQVAREGTKKTLFANIVEICKRLHRSPDHLIQYLFAELGTTGSIDGNQRLLIKGRFQQKQIEIVLKRYIAEYVQCKTCRSPDTNLIKENRLFFLQCESCGSSRTVSAIKTGFMAQTGKRSAMRNAA
jgi:translation initiation factor 2 subunit 2